MTCKTFALVAFDIEDGVDKMCVYHDKQHRVWCILSAYKMTSLRRKGGGQYMASDVTYLHCMGIGTGGHRGHVPPPPPPIILPNEIFLTQYALLSRKLAHKMFILNKIFRLASLANQDTSN